MRDIRLRHSYSLMIRKYDEKFAMYSRQWYENILPIIAKHQITNSRGNKRGCVLALQIENEYFEYLKGFPVGLDDEMKQLAKSARDCGITVPLFTNDAFEAGSYIIPTSPDLRVQSKLWHRKKRYGLDLYGFDKYVVFAPGSDPLGNLLCNVNESTVWKDWDPITVTKSLDSIENTVRGFGNAAAKVLLLIPLPSHPILHHLFSPHFSFRSCKVVGSITTVCARGLTRFTNSTAMATRECWWTQWRTKAVICGICTCFMEERRGERWRTQMFTFRMITVLQFASLGSCLVDCASSASLYSSTKPFLQHPLTCSALIRHTGPSLCQCPLC